MYLLLLSLDPVSYTHLDVDKRQAKTNIISLYLSTEITQILDY